MKISETSDFSVPRQNRFAISNILLTQETQLHRKMRKLEEKNWGILI